MKIPATLPISGEQSRAARFQLGLTQANVIEESGLPGHKLKNFETGRFVPDMPFLENLRDFYAGKGIDITESATPAEQSEHSGITSGASMVRPVSRMCFYVSDQLPDAMVDQIGRRCLFNLMDFKVPFVGVRLQMRAVSVENTSANQLVLNGLLNNAVEDALFDVRTNKAATTVLG